MSGNGWDRVPLRAVAADGGLFVDGDWVESKDQDPNGEIRLIQLADVGDSVFLDKSDRSINSSKFHELRCTEVLPGDILIARMPDPIARSAILPEGLGYSAITVVDVAILRAGIGWDKRYVMWSINSSSFRTDVDSRVSGSTRQRISRSALGRTKLFKPPLETQQRIADYLDQETAEIDAAVADLDKYVELLEKRKLSKIEAVLNTTDYRMCSVGLFADVTLGKMITTSPPSAGGVEKEYLRAAHVQPGGRFDFTVASKKMWFSEKERERLDLRAGDIVVVEGGAGFGRSAYLESDLEEWGFQNSINRLRVDSSKADGRFVQLMLNRALLNGSIGISVDTATLPHFTAEKLSRFQIPLCELTEQKQISREIHEENLAADSLIAEANRLRELLLKRRAVLISDVVTGRKQV